MVRIVYEAHLKISGRLRLLNNVAFEDSSFNSPIIYSHIQLYALFPRHIATNGRH